MGWGSNPQFCISQRTLNFASAKQIWEERYKEKYGEANISQQSPRASNYAIVQLTGTAYALRMYRTRIITWHQSGRIDYVEYNTGVTRNVQSAFGPLRIWRDSRLPMRQKARFGEWGGKHYPFNDLTIEADGKIYGLKDRLRRVKPEAKKERAAIIKQFKTYAVPRILLGEFGRKFCVRGQFGGYEARVPNSNQEKTRVFFALSENASNAEIDPSLEYMAALSSNFGRRKITYPTPELASFAAINALVRHALCDSYNNPWYEDYTVEYPPVAVADL
jgi:hypothetical protein